MLVYISLLEIRRDGTDPPNRSARNIQQNVIGAKMGAGETVMRLPSDIGYAIKANSIKVNILTPQEWDTRRPIDCGAASRRDPAAEF
jgi:hypothetical protein